MEKLSHERIHPVRPVIKKPAQDLVHEAILEEILLAAGLESLD